MSHEEWAIEGMALLIIVLLGCPISFLANRIRSRAEVEPPSAEIRARIARKMNWYPRVELLMYFFAAVISIYFIAKMLQFLAKMRAWALIRRFEADVVYVFSSDTEFLYWIVPGLFLGLLVGGYISAPFAWLISRGDYVAIQRLIIEMEGTRSNRLLHITMLLCVLATCVTFFGATNTYFVFTDEALVSSEFFQVRNIEHPYSELRSIHNDISTSGPSLQSGHSEHFVAIFEDDYEFRTHELPAKSSSRERHDLRMFLQGFIGD